jgi:serine/threonine protein phosphatase 1
MPDRMTFAVGDIHGCFDKLMRLLAACESASGGDRSVRFVFVGDYVDRGPDASKVIALLIELQRQEQDRFVCLRGNHEELLAKAARVGRTDSDLMTWWGNGGEATLDSYGVNDPSDLPAQHLAWIEALPLTLKDRRRLFVHAGIRPGVSIPEQAERDLLWIREPFLSSDARHGALVVHGHTPTRSGLPDLRPNRLNIDTGACFGRPLTAALFSQDQTMPLMFINDLGETW